MTDRIIARSPAEDAVIDQFMQWLVDVGAEDFRDTFAIMGYVALHPDHAGIVARFVLDELRAAGQSR
jgi:hypothetical protein